MQTEKKQTAITSFFGGFKPKSIAKPIKPKNESINVDLNQIEQEERVESSPITDRNANIDSCSVKIQSSSKKVAPKKEENEYLWTIKFRKLRESHFYVEKEEKKLKIEGKGLSNTDEAVYANSETQNVDLFKMNKNDLQRYRNFDLKDEKNVVPAFWPSRPWDNEFKPLDDEDSQQIQNEIKKIENDIKNDVIKSHPDGISVNIDRNECKKESISRKRSRESKKVNQMRSIFYASTKFFETDDDDETDWNDNM